MDAGKKTEFRPHPRATTNWISSLTFWWVIDIFWKGYKKDLEVEDLYEPLDEHKSAYLGDKIERLWLAELKSAAKEERRPSLFRVMMRCFGWSLFGYGMILLVMELVLRIHQPIFIGNLVHYFNQQELAGIGNGTVFESERAETAQPLFIGQLVKFFSPGVRTISTDMAYAYAGGIVICSALNVYFIHPYMMAVFHIGMKIRVACCSLIYRKSLRLSKTALGHTTVGQVVNLLSNDVNRFDVAVIFVHYLWIGPLETVVITYLMWREVGVSAIIGVASLLMFIPLQAYLGKKSSVYRLRTAIRTDERVRLMNEIIGGMQVIKMYTWEKPFAAMVSSARKHEIQSIRATSFVRGIILSFIMFTTRISIFVSIVAYVLLGHQVTAEKVFVLTSFYNILRQTMTVFFPQAIAQAAEAMVSVRRLENFMLSDELEQVSARPSADANGVAKKTPIVKENGANPGANATDAPLGVTISGGNARWTEGAHEDTLTDIDLEMRPGRLVAVIGPVGSGKTSLLHVILRELPLTSGTLSVSGRLSYASQEPWMFAGSVRTNILFGEPYDKERYDRVVRVCALKRDFQLLPYGDRTIVGERGVSLSGGQRARVNLARAVYKQADIYMLDDPLSAVDTHVGKHLFEDCICGFLKDKTCILVTHQLQYLKHVDQILILKDGHIQKEGTYQELQESGLDFAKLLEPELEEDESIDDFGVRRSRSRQGSLKNALVGSVTSVDEKPSEPTEVAESRMKGGVSSKVYGSYFSAGGNGFVITLLLFLCVAAQLLASGCDYWITVWTHWEQDRMVPSRIPRFRDLNDTTFDALVNDTVFNGTASKSEASNGTEHDFTGILPTLPNIFSRSFAFFEDDGYMTTEACIIIYSAIMVATIVFTLWRSFTFFSVCMRASVNLHDRMFTSITRATMYFFNTNSSGRILNRFSKDMGSIDELLPSAMIDCVQIGLALIGIILVVAIVNPWLLLATIFVGGIFYLLRKIYLETSRSVKRLEGITRSPVFAHLNASLQGLTTIRAFEAQRILESEFDSHQDLHSSAWYIFIASSRAFGFWLDNVCLIYIAIVTLSFLFMDNSNTFGGNVGLAITQSIGLTGMFQWGMRQSAELENQMTSVERVSEYTALPAEPPLESAPEKKPAKSWPSEGCVEFSKVFMRYAPDEPPVLKNLNFSIRSQEKVGIVGRTGAGKSSLISALFRLAPLEGQILIDGIDCANIGLHDLRSKLSIIPQEPVLFSGTMRKNLDPFDEYPDGVLWSALEEVELKEAVMDLSAGLDSKMSEGGGNFSVGQRQLVCLARAIVRDNRILVLDEATANVDPQTDALIQSTIREKFATCTVLTIAHRLNTVMDSDKVLVMDAGTMVEFDHPHTLLANPDGFLSKMVEQTGKEMAKSLRKVAAKNFKEHEPQDSPTEQDPSSEAGPS